MPQVVYILFGAIWTLATAYALGRLLLSNLDLKLHAVEERIFSLLCGSALLSLVVFLLCTLHLARKGVFLALGALAILAAARRWRVAGPDLPPLPRRWRALFLLAYAGFGLFYLIYALAPEHSPDGMTYHLGFVGRYYREHGFVPITTNMYSSLSQGMEMLFLAAWAFGRHSSAALIHLAFLLVLPLAMLAYARRFDFTVPGVIGAVLVFASPIVGRDGVSAYNDVAVATILFAVFYLLQIWRAAPGRALLVPIGLLTGFAYALKYTAGLAIPYVLAYLLWHSIRRRQPLLRPAALVAGLAALSIAPWMIKNAIIVGNPVSPFFNRLFPNPYLSPRFEQDYLAGLREFNGVTPREVPYEVAIGGERLGGVLGPVFLLAPVALLALRWPQGGQLLLAAALFTLPYVFNIGTRFLLPGLPFWSLALGLAFRNSTGAGAALVIAHLLASIPAGVSKYSNPYAWRFQHSPPVRAALRLTPESDFLASNAHSYIFARMVERHVPAGEKVFTAGQLIAEAYTSHEIIVGYQSSLGERLRESFWMPLIPEWHPRRLLDFRFPARPLRRVRIIETASGTDQWSVTEIRVFHGDTELPRSSGLRARAHPNPWDVQRAFDNSPATRWRSQQDIRPGMFIEVDLGRERMIDRVRLEAPNDEFQVLLKLEGAPESGGWITLAAEPVEDQRGAVPGLRRAAAEELKLAGVRYFVVGNDDFEADDYFMNRKSWSITLLDDYGGTRLYRIE